MHYSIVSASTISLYKNNKALIAQPVLCGKFIRNIITNVNDNMNACATTIVQ